MDELDKITKRLEEKINVSSHLAAKVLYNQVTSDEITSLRDVEFKVYSQWGEDGIVWYLTRTIPITNKTFIEFGVENYKEANTRFLMIEDNWRGLIMDSGHHHIMNIKSQDIIWRYDLDVKEAFITAENINSLIEESGFEEDLGLLSIDIDGMDYWIWKELDVVRPRIVICEFNPVFGYKEAVTVPYNENFYRFDAHYSGIYFGASLKAMQMLGTDKGYTYLGMNSNACNAFFVRNDLVDFVPSKLLGNIQEYPCHYRSAMDASQKLLLLNVDKARSIVEELNVFDIKTETYKTVKELAL